MDFVHLHVHSQYSFLDGASSLDRLLEKGKAMGFSALALTDHNRLTGAIRFYEKARALGIKPIIGAEVELEGGYHLTLLCKDTVGYTSLCRLITDAHLNNRGKPPYATREMLGWFSDGLIALSGCDKGEIPTFLNQRELQKAGETARFYSEVFGEDFYIELIRYPSKNTFSSSYRLTEFAREEGFPVVATNNVHYAEMDDYKVKELLNSVDQNIPVSQLQGLRTAEQYLKSLQEMEMLFDDLPEAIAASEMIAGKCNLDLEPGELHFPKYDVPRGESDYTYLSKLAYSGALRIYGKARESNYNRTIVLLSRGLWYNISYRRIINLGLICQDRIISTSAHPAGLIQRVREPGKAISTLLVRLTSWSITASSSIRLR